MKIYPIKHDPYRWRSKTIENDLDKVEKLRFRLKYCAFRALNGAIYEAKFKEKNLSISRFDKASNCSTRVKTIIKFKWRYIPMG